MSEARRKRFLRANLAVVLLSLALIALVWAAITQRVRFESGQAVAEAEARNATLAIVLEEQTVRTLQGLDQVLGVVKYEHERSGANPEVPELALKGAIDARLYDYIGITDDRGDAGARTGASGANVSQRDYFQFLQRTTADEPFIGRPSPDPITGRQVITIARRLNRSDGSFAGVVYATVKPETFTRLYAQAGLGAHGLLGVVGLDGVARAMRSGTLTTFGEDMRGSMLLANQARSREGTFTSTEETEDVARFYSYRTLGEYPLVVSVATSVAEILTPPQQRSRIYMGGATLGSALILTLAAVLIFALARQRRVLDSFVRSDARFRATFDQAFVGMMQVGIDGRPLHVNQTICNMLGYSEDELLARSFRDLIHPEDGAADSVGTEKRFLRKGGATVWTNTSTTLVRDAEGKPDFCVSVIQDITEFKRIDRMKSEFVSTVSHELRTPLTSIRGSLGLIAGGIAGPLPDAAAKLVDIAKSNCERLIRLINDILDTEKIASGKMEYDLHVIELEPLIVETLAANEGFARNGQVTFELHPAGQPLRVDVDSGRLVQVLTNLLSNAVKFSPPGGVVEVGIARAGAFVRVQVRDHGPGIPEEFRGRIFQKFSQADSSDTRPKGGTGLGLNISKSIIERLGGTIGFETAAGDGATFFFELPEYAGVPATVPFPAKHGAARPRVLICEDEPDIARLMGMMLGKAGYDTDLAGTAARALELAAVNSYAAMTLDIKLPDGDGIALVRSLREHVRTFEMPIVVVSAVSEKDHIKFGHEAFTISDWLGKPIDENRLALAIRHAIEGTAKERPRILHVEDDLDIQRIIAAIAHGFATFEFAATLHEARARLLLAKFDLVILDLSLPDGSGWDLVDRIEALEPRPRVIVFSASTLSAAESRRVDAVLVKAATTNDELLGVIKALTTERTEHTETLSK